MTETRTRQLYIDLAKGIGIIFVLFSHFTGFPWFGNGIVDFYMALFFFLSGYLYRPGGSFGANVSKRLKSLLIPYALFSLLLYAEYVGTRLIQGELVIGRSSLWEFLKPLVGALYGRSLLYAPHILEGMGMDGAGEYNVEFMVMNNNPMWFILAMALCYVIFYRVVDVFLDKWTNRMAISIVCVATTIVCSYSPILLPWSVDLAGALLFMMLMGAYLGQRDYYHSEELGIKHFLLVLTMVVIYLVMTDIANPINISLRDYGYPGVIGACWFLATSFSGTILFVWLCRYGELLPRGVVNIFAKVGAHTYTIMALHIVLAKYLNKAYYIFPMSFPFDRSCGWYWLYWMVIDLIIIIFCILFDGVIRWGWKKVRR